MLAQSFLSSINHSACLLFGNLYSTIRKVEDADDIQRVPASVAGGSEVEENKSKRENAGNDGKQQETSSTTINTAELPPHIVLGMPALSPTMV